jgi:galactose mutarotase-like enzyme
MFAIAVKQEQYTTYVLSDELSETKLEVVPERGGIITSWQVKGQEMLYLDAERFANPALTVRGGIPILFPICGNLPDNTFRYKNQAYTLKQHGFARDLLWEVGDRSTENQLSISLHLNSNDQTRAVYPFDFQITFTYRLVGNSLQIYQRFTNTSSEPIPFSVGLHPYFNVTDKSQLQFDIPAAQGLNQRDQTAYDFTGQFDFEADELDIAFLSVNQQSASVTDMSRKLRLTLQYDPIYSTLVFWTVKGKEFYCLEPWSAPRNALNSGTNLTHLDPGQTMEVLVRFIASFL